MFNRAIIGTAQFGGNYGITNINGKVSSKEIKKIIDLASSKNINTLDTAISYGTSESNISNHINNKWKVGTKIQRIPQSVSDINGWISNQIDGSLKRMQINKLSYLLLHEPLQLNSKVGNQIWQSLENLKSKKKIDKIGYSIYSPLELEKLVEIYKPDIVQGPYNLLDRRIETSGWLKILNEKRVEFHARSIFLQGLLLMNPSLRLSKFQAWSKVWRKWDKFVNDSQLSPVQLCFSFVYNNKKIDRTVFGVESEKQLKDILNQESVSHFKAPNFNVEDENLINPSNWNKL